MHFQCDLVLATVDKVEQADTKSEPGAIATGRMLKF